MASGSRWSVFSRRGPVSPISDGSSSNAMHGQQRHERSVVRAPGRGSIFRIELAEVYVDDTASRIVAPCAGTQPRKFPSRQSTVHAYPLTASSFASRARSNAQSVSDHSQGGYCGCARADACITDDRTPLAASVIACAARLLQNRCIETHQNKSTPRGGASEPSNNRASAPRGGAAAFRTNH